MYTDQKAARIFGGLFLLTFVTSIAGVLLYGPVLDQEDYIVNGSADWRIGPDPLRWTRCGWSTQPSP